MNVSKPRDSIFRDVLQVSPEIIAAMSDNQLTALMGRLLLAQAYRCGSPIEEIRVNAEDKAKDDGCDGWSAKPSSPDEWLGSTDTCWQFKAGTAGEPSRLAEEITKTIPMETLANGGRFVLISSGSKNGKKGENDRLNKLVASARRVKLPIDKIDVIGSERLATWCNQHPAIAAYLTGMPSGLCPFSEWARSPVHQVPYQASATARLEIEKRRKELDFKTGNIHHLHIFGPPGVGKTRFALELCREAEWCSTVIYIRDASDHRLLELIDTASTANGVRLTVVADEVQQPEQISVLCDSVERGNERIHLITIGHCGSPDSRRIPSLLVPPLGDKEMHEVLMGWYPALPPEHRDFVVRFADGYVRLAWLSADAVARDPTMNIRGLLDQDDIRVFLDKMLGPNSRRALYVVAALTSIGWFDDKQEEGEAVSKHFGLDWNVVREEVDKFDRHFGIVPRGGRYRYISPTPLGIYLAVEAWTTYPDLMKSLAEALQSEEARKAYYDRIQLMASTPQARKYAREELPLFFRVDDFVEDSSVQRWSALSSADPDEAARNVLKVLSGSSLEDRRRIKDNARRVLVWTLVRLAWRSTSFKPAVKALLLLAEAENETRASNASNEFVARFQILLGGTSVPYLNRLSFVDELIAEERPSWVSLVIKALAQVGKQQEYRWDIGPASDELPEKEWRPRTKKEHQECIKAAISKLTDIANRKIVGIQSDLVAAADDLSMMLRKSREGELVVHFFDAVRNNYPDTREPLRRVIADLIYHEKKYWKSLSLEELRELEILHSCFMESTLEARLQQYVGHAFWDPIDQVDLKPLAEELFSSPEALIEYWPWLTSGEAADGWRLGEALAVIDSKGELAETMPSIPGGGVDMRLLCGYINTKRKTLGDVWYEKWAEHQFKQKPIHFAFMFEVFWRCGVTESMARMMADIIRNEPVGPRSIGQIIYGRWDDYLSAETLETILRSLADTGHRDTAIVILGRRIKANSEEMEKWKQFALELVTASDLIRSDNSVGYQWKEVAEVLVADYSEEIVSAIFREMSDRVTDSWFAEYSEAAKILRACAERNPKGVWQAIYPYLSPPHLHYRLIIGFPSGVIDILPAGDIEAWISESPEERASMMAQLVSVDVSADGNLASRILGNYGDNEKIASAFFSEYFSGSWWGPSSVHWDQLAESLEAVARQTALPKLRDWAIDRARYLRNMAERERQREAEEDLRGW